MVVLPIPKVQAGFLTKRSTWISCNGRFTMWYFSLWSILCIAVNSFMSTIVHCPKAIQHLYCCGSTNTFFQRHVGKHEISHNIEHFWIQSIQAEFFVKTFTLNFLERKVYNIARLRTFSPHEEYRQCCSKTFSSWCMQNGLIFAFAVSHIWEPF